MRKTVQISDALKKEFPKIFFSKEIIANFEQYFDILYQWNKKINLTAIRDPERMIIKHLCDSLVIFKTKIGANLQHPFSGTLLDMGSGAGIPGILLLICNPLLHLVSVDKSSKKIGFQEFIKSKLMLMNLHPISDRLEALIDRQDYESSQDCIVSRAFDQIKDLFECSRFFLKPDAHLILWKGKEWKNELNHVPNVLRSQFQLVETCEYQFERFDIGGTILVFQNSK